MSYQPVNDAEKRLIEAMPLPIQHGFNPWSIYIQAVHETGNFKKVIGHANYWGITQPYKWTGRVFEVPTHEYIKGKRVEMVRKFIDWETTEEALYWYMDLVKRLYPAANGNKANPILFFSGLQNGKYQWATDPDYVPQLERLYRDISTNKELDEMLKKATHEGTANV